MNKSIVSAFFKCQFCQKRLKIKPKNQLGFSMMHKGPYGTRFIADNICEKLNWGRKKCLKK